jgi:hypothetical protein
MAVCTYRNVNGVQDERSSEDHPRDRHRRQRADERQIEPTLQHLRQLVGGLIELVRFSDGDCNANENGHFLKEKHTFVYTDPKHGLTVPLIGMAVLFGKLTRGGCETSLRLSLDAVTQRVQFPPTTATET